MYYKDKKKKKTNLSFLNRTLPFSILYIILTRHKLYNDILSQNNNELHRDNIM